MVIWRSCFGFQEAAELQVDFPWHFSVIHSFALLAKEGIRVLKLCFHGLKVAAPRPLMIPKSRQTVAVGKSGREKIPAGFCSLPPLPRAPVCRCLVHHQKPGLRPTMSILMKTFTFSPTLCASLLRFAAEMNDLLAEMREVESPVQFELLVLKMEQISREMEAMGWEERG